MIHLNNTQITDVVRSYFDLSHVPGRLRFDALLAGSITGSAWIDDFDQPTWGILQEAAYGTLHLQGSFPDGLLAEMIETRKQHGDVLFGFWEDDIPAHNSLPPTMYDGFVLESYTRASEVDLSQWLVQVPSGHQCRAIDDALFPRLQDYQFYSDMFGSADRALSDPIGYVMISGEDILCEAYAATAARGVIEMGVNTMEGHRRQGLATITCAHVIHEAEKRGYRTYWNCALQNKASIALAHKLGYAPMTQYRLWGWF